jgi:hypothetical protein
MKKTFNAGVSRILLILLFLCSVSTGGWSQFIFQDANTIADLLEMLPNQSGNEKTDTLNTLAGLLQSNYLHLPENGNGPLTTRMILDAAVKSPFLSVLASPPEDLKLLTNKDLPTSPKSVRNIAPSAIPETLADAFSKFLINRARMELIATLVDTIAQASKEYPELPFFMPLTCQYIATLTSSAYPNSILQSLPLFAEADIRNIPSRLAFLDTIQAEYPELDAKRAGFYASLMASEYGLLIKVLSVLYTDLGKSSGAYTILYDLNSTVTPYATSDKIKNLRDAISCLRLSYIVAAGFSHGDPKRFYTQKEILDFFQEQNHGARNANLFFGLFYLSVPSDLTFNNTSVKKLMEMNIESGLIGEFASVVASQVGSLSAAYSTLSENLSEKRDKPIDEAARMRILLEYAATFMNFLTADSTLQIILGDEGANTLKRSPEYKLYNSIMKNGISIVTAFHSKDYPYVLHSFTGALREVAGAYASSVPDSSGAEVLEAIKKLDSALSFIAAIAVAENSEEMEKIIDEYALPSTSYRAKFRDAGNLTINSYLGAVGGMVVPAFAFNSYGAYAPLGVSLNFNWNCNCFSSGTIFVGLLDFGSLVAYRINDAQGVLPSFDVRSLLSFSAGGLISLFKSPISILGGIRSTPGIVSITADSVVYSSRTQWELILALVVDIPIINMAAW